MKVMGDLGQIVPVWYDVRDKDAVKRYLTFPKTCSNASTTQSTLSLRVEQ